MALVKAVAQNEAVLPQLHSMQSKRVWRDFSSGSCDIALIVPSTNLKMVK